MFIGKRTSSAGSVTAQVGGSTMGLALGRVCLVLVLVAVAGCAMRGAAAESDDPSETHGEAIEAGPRVVVAATASEDGPADEGVSEQYRAGVDARVREATGREGRGRNAVDGNAVDGESAQGDAAELTPADRDGAAPAGSKAASVSLARRRLSDDICDHPLYPLRADAAWLYRLTLGGHEAGWRLHRVVGRGPGWAEVSIQILAPAGPWHADAGPGSAPVSGSSAGTRRPSDTRTRSDNRTQSDTSPADRGPLQLQSRTVRVGCYEMGLAAGLFAVTVDPSPETGTTVAQSTREEPVVAGSISLLPPEALEPGTTWQWRPPQAGSIAPSRNARAESEIVTEVVGSEQVETPAGQFDSVVLQHATTGVEGESSKAAREHVAWGVGPVVHAEEATQYVLVSYLQPGPDGGEARYDDRLPTTAFERLRTASSESDDGPDTSAADVVQLVGAIAKAPAEELLDTGIFGRPVGPSDGPGNVELDIAARVRNDALVVTGATNLPSGTWLMVVLRDSDAFADLGYYGGTTHTVTEVQDGAIEMVFPIFELASGPVEILMVFDPAGQAFDLVQPAVVHERYGPDGRRMTGKDVYDLFGHRAAVVTLGVRNP